MGRVQTAAAGRLVLQAQRLLSTPVAFTPAPAAGSGRVALTGKPQKFENYVKALKMWFAVSVYSPEKECFVSVFDVITGRKQAAEALKKACAVLGDKVSERTEELQARLTELERFRKATVEREFRIKELRDEIERLKAEKK